MTARRKRKPFTAEEKEYIFTTLVQAKEEDKDVKAVKMYLADELDASFHTVHNTYIKMRKEQKDSLEDSKSDLLTPLEVEDSVTEYVKNDAQITLELSERIDELNTREKEETQVAPSNSTSKELESLTSELIRVQMEVLLNRIESLTTERDEWKNKALTLEAERKAIAILLNNK